ncbi:MAG: tRNA glutamyl-Q(34) synthetase GluQRS [Nitrosomonas sp.]|nr:tRNA glutamyl-Q(34) synthetase GluQRS [Nitrosomonas sp.]MDP1949916.1 tRNA glutamyl-Q(34) synthetase GluQRS [Nitrosomonas sp.]
MKNNQTETIAYRGRFAPSPTGLLHFGSLVTAVSSYLEAKVHDGEWLVRIEDLDASREVPGASSKILYMLENLGMVWDGEVIYQSQRKRYYQDALNSIRRLGLVYSCTCSRKEIAASCIIGEIGPIYPGTCRGNLASKKHTALRVRTDNKPINFEDVLRGSIAQRLESDTGDFVLRRADGTFAYQLAVVVDDAEQNITHVVRGTDLLESTPRQIYLQQLLGYAIPSYMHLPIVTNSSGEKLSKQTRADPIDLSKAPSLLVAALRYLGQAPPDELANCNNSSIWQWAIENWKRDKIL